MQIWSIQGRRPHIHQASTALKLCFTQLPLPLNKDVIRILNQGSYLDWKQSSKERGCNTSELKCLAGNHVKFFSFLAPNRSYGSLLSNIHGHLCYKVGYYFFNAVGFYSVTSEERKEKKFIW